MKYGSINSAKMTFLFVCSQGFQEDQWEWRGESTLVDSSVFLLLF